MNEAPVLVLNVKSIVAVMEPIWLHAMPYAPFVPTALMLGEIKA